MRETAWRLKEALDGLVAISEQQSRSIAAARERAARLEAELLRRVKARAMGEELAPTPLGPEFDVLGMLDDSSVDESERGALLELAAALADEIGRSGEPTGIEIALCIAEIREIGHEPSEVEETMPEVPTFGIEPAERYASAYRFLQEMSQTWSAVGARLEASVQRQDAALARAHGLVVDLVERIGR